MPGSHVPRLVSQQIITLSHTILAPVLHTCVMVVLAFSSSDDGFVSWVLWQRACSAAGEAGPSTSRVHCADFRPSVGSEALQDISVNSLWYNSAEFWPAGLGMRWWSVGSSACGASPWLGR